MKDPLTGQVQIPNCTQRRLKHAWAGHPTRRHMRISKAVLGVRPHAESRPPKLHVDARRGLNHMDAGDTHPETGLLSPCAACLLSISMGLLTPKLLILRVVTVDSMDCRSGATPPDARCFSHIK